MKAVGLTRYLPISDPESLIDLDLPAPEPTARDLLVRVEAIAVNPVDTKVRRSQPARTEPAPRVLGWDAAGVVEAVGGDATLFKPGDPVFYAGSIARAGSYSEFQLVDERIVGRKPVSLDFAAAAALPLTSITAWESLFDRLRIERDGGHRGRSILIIGGAGGVGSVAIQLARIAGLVVIATASRPETESWVRKLGADHVLNHAEPLAPQLEAAGHGTVDFILNTADTDGYWDVLAGLIKPQGAIVLIVGSGSPRDIELFKSKSVTIAWEFMFTRPIFGTDDMQAQHALLNLVAALVDEGRLLTTQTEVLEPICARTLREAHARLESGRTIGKITLRGWR